MVGGVKRDLESYRCQHFVEGVRAQAPAPKPRTAMSNAVPWTANGTSGAIGACAPKLVKKEVKPGHEVSPSSLFVVGENAQDTVKTPGSAMMSAVLCIVNGRFGLLGAVAPRHVEQGHNIVIVGSKWRLHAPGKNVSDQQMRNRIATHSAAQLIVFSHLGVIGLSVPPPVVLKGNNHDNVASHNRWNAEDDNAAQSYCRLGNVKEFVSMVEIWQLGFVNVQKDGLVNAVRMT